MRAGHGGFATTGRERLRDRRSKRRHKDCEQS